MNTTTGSSRGPTPLLTSSHGVTQQSEIADVTRESNGHRTFSASASASGFEQTARTDRTDNKPRCEEIGLFIESIRSDIEAMRNGRKLEVPCCQINLPTSPFPCPGRCPTPVPCSPPLLCSPPLPCRSPLSGLCVPAGTWHKPMHELSYPATIEVVQPLGDNSLFVKWRVENTGNIAGFEVFLDGYLTNRYFSCIHRAAVICNVNLHCGHRILLRAISSIKRCASAAVAPTCGQLCASPASATNYNNPEASFPQADGSFWTPSIYHYEPNFPASSSTSLVRY